MKHVQQTIFAPPTGNCLAACVASLFNLPLWLVPNFVTYGEGWWDRLGGFAADNGYRLLCLPRAVDQKWHGKFMFGDYCIVTVRSPRGNWNHCVIAEILTGEVVWDPHPEGWEEGHQLADEDIVDWILFAMIR